MPNRIIEYLETVRRQIRWKRAQTPIIEDIKKHLSDQKDALIKDGFNEETAISKAIEDMGDPVVVGEQLDRKHRPRPDWPLLAMTAILLLLGLSLQFIIRTDIGNRIEIFYRQAIWVGLAIFVMLAAYFLDFTIIGKYSWLIYLLLLIMTIVGYWYYGSWNARLTAVYPLLLFPTTFAGMVYSMRKKGYGGLILVEVAAIVPAFLTLFMHNSTVLFLICLSCLSILTCVLFKGWFNVSKLNSLLILLLSSAVILSIMFFLLMIQPYYRQRLNILFNPSLHLYIGAVIQQILFHSRLIGEGLPLSGYYGQYPVSRILPEANTDFLLTYLTYKFGWLFYIGIITIFIFFIIRSILISKRQKSILGQLVSLAIILTFAIQCFTFIVSNLGFLPFGPLSLPLISYDGHSLLTNMFLIGFLLSTFRTGDLVRENVDVVVAKSGRLIQYDNGRIIIDLKTHSIN